MRHYLKSWLLTISFVRNINEMRFDQLHLMYNPSHLTHEYYERVKMDSELEHQIGRLRNFQQIIHEIDNQQLLGDFIEFGTWQGFSLLWMAYFCQQNALLDRTLVGIDGFIGLPNDEGVFNAGQFKNTSQKRVQHGLHATRELYPQIKKNIHVYQSLFNEKEKIGAILAGRTFVFVHLDADLSSSTIEVLNRLEENDALADTCYLLFDDYGCDTSLRQTVDEAMIELQRKKWNITVHSSTKLTKNFKLQRK